jgi:hypothetical protein
MIEFTAGHFEELCRAAPVRERMGSLETERRAAVRKFSFRLVLGMAAAAVAGVILFTAGWELTAFFAGILLFVGAGVWALSPLMAAKEALKHPVLETLAAQGGLEYIPAGFDPPAYGAARRLLFGASLSSETFSDLFHGADEEGHGHAVYEAILSRRSGKNSVIVFSGQVYALQRHAPGTAITVILPDRKLFNFFKPACDMQRVPIDFDADFEKRFEVYSTDALAARQLIFDSDLRRILLELREGGRILALLTPEEAVVAVHGKDRFEPGSMLRSRAAEDRVRLMFDDVCASLAVLRRLKAKLG